MAQSRSGNSQVRSLPLFLISGNSAIQLFPPFSELKENGISRSSSRKEGWLNQLRRLHFAIVSHDFRASRLNLQAVCHLP